MAIYGVPSIVIIMAAYDGSLLHITFWMFIGEAMGLYDKKKVMLAV